MFKETRTKNKMSQKEMAEILEVTQSMISKYEKGIKRPEFETMNKFYKKFGIEELTQELKKEFERETI